MTAADGTDCDYDEAAECDYDEGYEDGMERGVAEERAAVVAWLREHSGTATANCIERGEHRG